MTLAAPAAPSLRVVTEMVPAADGSFSARVTVPARAPPGPAHLSMPESEKDQLPCPPPAGCGVDLDVLPALARSLDAGPGGG